MKMAGDFLGGAGGGPTTSTAYSASPFNSSGWTVNTGTGSAGGGALAGYLPYIVGGVVLLVALRAMRKKG